MGIFAQLGWIAACSKHMQSSVAGSVGDGAEGEVNDEDDVEPTSLGQSAAASYQVRLSSSVLIYFVPLCG